MTFDLCKVYLFVEHLFCNWHWREAEHIMVNERISLPRAADIRNLQTNIPQQRCKNRLQIFSKLNPAVYKKDTVS